MVIKLLIRVKNLKKNPGMVSILKRRCSVMSLITRLVYDTRVHDISLETNRKHDFIVTCNGIRKKFPLNTPINTIKSEIIAWILLTHKNNSKNFKNIPKPKKKIIAGQNANYTIFTELFPENLFKKSKVI